MSEEYKHMDDLFRERFGNFEVEPPAHVWENVKSGIASSNGGKTGGKPFMGGITGISLLIITIGIASFFILSNSFIMNEEEVVNAPASEMNDEFLALNSMDANESSQPNNNKSEVAVANTIAEKETEKNNPSSTKKKNTSAKTRIKKNNSSKIVIEANVTTPVSSDIVGKSRLTAEAEKTGINTLTPKDDARINFESRRSDNYISLSGNHSHTMLNTDKFEGKSRRSDYVNNGTWKLGVFFTPELITYPADDGLKNYSKTFEVNVAHHRNNLIFQTGLGLSLVTDEGDNHIDYRKHLGSYEDVYDVIVDSTNTGWDITYLTETVDVYDSIESEVITPTKRKFTYIQIPALFGYGKESRRFSWFVKGGPSLLLLIDQNIPEANMGNSSDMMVGSESTLPGRVRSHWQFIMSAGASYKLGNKVSLSVEPMFRYYINSAYENSKLNTKHPYSIGLRTGLIYNF
jgi:hypothetical protein